MIHHYINGEHTSQYETIMHWINSNPSSDIEELKAIFYKASTDRGIDGEIMRDFLLSDGIELIFED